MLFKGKYFAISKPNILEEQYINYKNEIEILCKKFVEYNFENDKYFDLDMVIFSRNEYKIFFEYYNNYKQQLKVYIDNLFYTYRTKLRHENMINKIDNEINNEYYLSNKKSKI